MTDREGFMKSSAVAVSAAEAAEAPRPSLPEAAGEVCFTCRKATLVAVAMCPSCREWVLDRQTAKALDAAKEAPEGDPGDIPCAGGFLYPGACSDSCGAPYYEPEKGEHDRRIGHECCSTVATEYVALLSALAALRDERDEARARGKALRDRIEALETNLEDVFWRERRYCGPVQYRTGAHDAEHWIAAELRRALSVGSTAGGDRT